jgi:extracellular matrix protein 14
MQLSHNTLSTISFFVILLFCAPIQAFAVPWSSGGFAATQRHPEQSPKHRSVFPQLTWLRDTAIEKVFGLTPKTVKPGCDKHTPRPASSQLPSTLLAKYGGDVVLRFNLSTPYEEQALAEAADTLFLDVWEFTNNWADIRLREDDVRLITTRRRGSC